MDGEERRRRRKEARAAQGEDYRLHVQPRLMRYIELQRSAQAWGRLVACLLFAGNGGALVLMPLLAATSRAPQATGSAPTWFALGLVAACVLALAAYLNTFFQARALSGSIGQQTFIGEAINYDVQWPVRYIDDPRGRDFRSRPEITITFFVSVAAGIASAALFIVGAIRLAP